MALSKKQIAEAFSNGNFDKANPFMAKDIKWEIVNDKLLMDKESVIAFCNQTAAFFKTVTTNFYMQNVISKKNLIVITGKAEFLNAAKKKTCVSACDVYRFEDSGMLKEITSYCIVIDK
jgi:hypothetical protein